jgi:hypothetical protein
VLNALARKVLGWAGGSQFEFGMSFSLLMEPEFLVAVALPHRRLTFMRPFRNGNGNGNGEYTACAVLRYIMQL